MLDNLINQAVSFCLFCGHVEVSLGVCFDAIQWLTRVMSNELVQTLLMIEDFSRLDLNIYCLSLGTP